MRSRIVAATHVAGLMQALKEPELALWAAYLLLVPFYAWRSGLPQPADILLAVLFGLMVRRGSPKLVAPLVRARDALLAFAGYAAFVNLVWGILLLDYDVKKIGAIGFAAFYLFNAAAFWLCLLLYQRFGRRFIVVTIWGIAASLLMQLLLFSARGGTELYRERLFFNNPNQFGYYALISAAVIAFGYRLVRMPAVVAAAALAAATLFAASSLSKAALIGTAALALVAAVRKPLLVMLTAGLLIGGAYIRDPAVLLERVSARMTEIGDQNDDSLEGRGYARIMMHPEYLALGAGEVGHDRHGDFGGELHSSWATVVFSYGVVGAVLLVAFLWRALRPLRIRDSLVLVPVFWFGLTHQGLRFRLFWVLLAVLLVASVELRRRRLDAGQAGRRRGALQRQ